VHDIRTQCQTRPHTWLHNHWVCQRIYTSYLIEALERAVWVGGERDTPGIGPELPILVAHRAECATGVECDWRAERQRWLSGEPAQVADRLLRVLDAQEFARCRGVSASVGAHANRHCRHRRSAAH
jgi:hypothetical protein